jgi:hypothetical protein
MSESLPHRVFPAIVIALAIILLTPTPLLANSALPWVFGMGPVLLLGLIPVIFIEGLVLDRRLGLGGRAMGVSAVANIVSTLVGIAGMVIPLIAFPAAMMMPYHGGAPLYLGLLLWLVPLFFVSWRIEYAVARWMLRRSLAGSAASSSTPVPVGSQPGSLTAVPRLRPSLSRGMFDANLASYALLAMIVGVFWVEGTFNQYGGAHQASAVGTLRALNTAEITYASTYNKGYSSSLADLASPPNPTAGAAELIDSKLASGEKMCSVRRYQSNEIAIKFRFIYRPIRQRPTGKITDFALIARPLEGEGLSYFADPSGVIRYTDEDREATARDSGAGTRTAPPDKAQQSLGWIIGAERRYYTDYKEFSPSLAALAGYLLIDPELASGEKMFRVTRFHPFVEVGYRFTYRPVRGWTGKITRFTLVARPLKYEGQYTASFFADQSDVIRMTTEDREATAGDSGIEQEKLPPGSPADALWSIMAAEKTFYSRYSKGFSPSLAALGGLPPAGTLWAPTAEAAGLIDSDLARGEKSGYRFVYSPGPRNDKGEITTYAITASPIKIKPETANYYYTDQTGVIRQNSTQPATASDSPLAG